MASLDKGTRVARMTLKFPNPSRSYDSRQHCVRFWGYDEALEIPFFVEAAALRHIDPGAEGDGPGLLSIFDRHRPRIMKAASRIYSRHSKGSYTLAGSDIG